MPLIHAPRIALNKKRMKVANPPDLDVMSLMVKNF
jgi:hypothetical protein